MLPLWESMVLFDWMAMAQQTAGRMASHCRGRQFARGLVARLAQQLPRWSTFGTKVRLVIALTLVWVFAASAPAQASIHSYLEPERQTIMYRSRLSLRDNQDLAWQTILFKRVKDGEVIALNLRLISFPGQLTLNHPQSLFVEQGGIQTWELPDETLLDPQLQSVNSSLAQYDAKPLLMSLERPAPLTLTVTLEDQGQRQLLVPPYVVKEWLQLQEIPFG